MALRASRPAVAAGFGVVVEESPTVAAAGSAVAVGPAGRKSDVDCGGRLWPDRWRWWFGGECGVVGPWGWRVCGVVSLGWPGRPLGSAPPPARAQVLPRLVSLVLAAPPGAVGPFGRLVDSV